jgi:CysZ protein
MFVGLRHWIIQLNAWLSSYLPVWLAWLGMVVWLIFIVGFLAIIIFTFMTLANLVAAPFNSLLSEKVECYLTGVASQDTSLIQIIKEIPRVLARQLAVIFYYLPRAVALLILYFIPVIQAAASVISFLFHAWSLSLTYMDYPMDNHKVSFYEMRQWLKQRRVMAFGFGIAILISSMVPVFNFVVMPAAVAGATKWWVDEQRLKIQ